MMESYVLRHTRLRPITEKLKRQGFIHHHHTPLAAECRSSVPTMMKLTETFPTERLNKPAELFR